MWLVLLYLQFQPSVIHNFSFLDFQAHSERANEMSGRETTTNQTANWESNKTSHAQVPCANGKQKPVFTMLSVQKPLLVFVLCDGLLFCATFMISTKSKQRENLRVFICFIFGTDVCVNRTNLFKHRISNLNVNFSLFVQKCCGYQFCDVYLWLLPIYRRNENENGHVKHFNLHVSDHNKSLN